MTALTRDEFRTEVQLACRNLPTTDPYYGTAGAVIDRFILRARNELLRMAIGPSGAMQKFPELRYDDTIGPTVAGANRIARPATFLSIDRITKQEDSTAVTSWASIRELPVEFKTLSLFAYLAKDSATGYASIWTRMGNDIAYYPTTDSSHVDYFHGYGIRRETLASSGAAFVADEFWDDPTVMLAAAKIQERRGWFSKSRELYARVKEIIADTSDISALEALGQDNAITVQGAPTRATVYGR